MPSTLPNLIAMAPSELEASFQTQLEALQQNSAPIQSWVKLGIAVAEAMLTVHREHLALQREALHAFEQQSAQWTHASRPHVRGLLARCRERVQVLDQLRRLHAHVYDQILALSPTPTRKRLSKPQPQSRA